MAANAFHKESKRFSESLSSNTQQAKIAVVIPVLNEERFIASVILLCKAYVNHVIVVDDGSSDRTAELAETVGAKVLQHDRNLGKARALTTGFKYAQLLQVDVIVSLDGDAQHEPADIPALVQPILKGEADVVVGSRFLSSPNNSPRWRQVGQHGLNLITNHFSGQQLSDSQSGFRAFSHSAVVSLALDTHGLAAESEMQFELKRLNMRVKEVPVNVYYLDANKRNPFTHGLEVVDAILALVARKRPLMFLTLPGVLLTLSGFLAGFRVISIFQDAKELPVGTAVLTAIFLLSGLLLSVTGVILNILGASIKELRDDIQILHLRNSFVPEKVKHQDA